VDVRLVFFHPPLKIWPFEAQNVSLLSYGLCYDNMFNYSYALRILNRSDPHLFVGPHLDDSGAGHGGQVDSQRLPDQDAGPGNSHQRPGINVIKHFSP
jgi:hypothetical protein